MSHATGEVWSHEAKLLGYFEYDGTSDFVCTRVHLTQSGVQENWRGDNERECVCSVERESVTLYTQYGFGFHWDGRVCWNCKAITDGIRDFESIDGHPFFNEWMVAHYGQVVACPNCGEMKLETNGVKAPIICGGCGALWYEWNLESKKSELCMNKMVG